jgi:RNA polymerase-binding protein DksA
VAKSRSKKTKPAQRTRGRSAVAAKRSAPPASKRTAIPAARSSSRAQVGAPQRRAKGVRNPAAGPAPRVEKPRSAAEAGDDGAVELVDPDQPLPKSQLSRKELGEFRQLLLAKRAELLGDVTNLTNEALKRNRQEASGDLSNMPIHMADIGTDNWEQEFTIGLLEQEKSILREIDEALERIDNGTYGICLATHKPISLARLRATPWAKYSIQYARMKERERYR